MNKDLNISGDAERNFIKAHVCIHLLKSTFILPLFPDTQTHFPLQIFLSILFYPTSIHIIHSGLRWTYCVHCRSSIFSTDVFPFMSLPKCSRVSTSSMCVKKECVNFLNPLNNLYMAIFTISGVTFVLWGSKFQTAYYIVILLHSCLNIPKFWGKIHFRA